jgi:hypothetical protein
MEPEKPYRILGVYYPERWNARKVGLDLCRLTRRLGFVPHIDPAHGPLENVAWRSESLHAEVRRRTFRTKQAEGWHQDGDLTPGARMNCQLVLWASNHPTEIRYNGVVYQPNPYEVVVFSNTLCFHRRPPGAPRIRWVFRQRVAP